MTLSSAARSALLHVNLPAMLVLIAVFAALLVYFDAFCRAMAPRSGTLEWIAMYDRPRLSFSALSARFDRRDRLPLLVFGGLSAGLVIFGVVLLIRQGGVSATALLDCPDALLRGVGGCAVFCGLSLPPFYALARVLCGRADAAACAAAVFALALVPSGAAYSFSVPCALLSVFFFLRALAGGGASRRGTLLMLAASGALLGLALWCDPGVLWLSPFPAALLAVWLYTRLRARAMRPGDAALAAAVFVLSALFLFVLTCLPTAALGRGMALPGALVTARFWHFVQARLSPGAFAINLTLLAGTSLLNPLFWWGGLLAAFCAVAAAVARRDGVGLCAAALYFGGMAVFLASGSALGVAGCAVTLGFVFSGLLRRSHAAAAYGYSAVCLALSAALPALAVLLL